ncbi:AlpA family phage regulatory protein [Citreicella sp. C3M06]|uniref:helix-turn-helix transcriptional regulator n=1 Tax=Citreicella sp. C3M06 TaxID=2841564 RepID=UPI001C08E277|nr:AlpA family phage regulatory protein [Citreicella sp. C3M06]MBU2962084.1 AlpA family phage regulatory protein [Citreicella sp. C3M06]
MPDVYLSILQLAARYSVHRATPWRWIKSDSNFPKPVVLSPGCTRWKLSELEAWEKSKTTRPAG